MSSVLLIAVALFVLGIALVGVGAFGAGIVYGAKKLNEINDASNERRVQIETDAYERRAKFETEQIVTREIAITGENKKRLDASVEYTQQMAAINTQGKVIPIKPS